MTGTTRIILGAKVNLRGTWGTQRYGSSLWRRLRNGIDPRSIVLEKKFMEDTAGLLLRSIYESATTALDSSLRRYSNET